MLLQNRVIAHTEGEFGRAGRPTSVAKLPSLDCVGTRPWCRSRASEVRSGAESVAGRVIRSSFTLTLISFFMVREQLVEGKSTTVSL